MIIPVGLITQALKNRKNSLAGVREMQQNKWQEREHERYSPAVAGSRMEGARSQGMQEASRSEEQLPAKCQQGNEDFSSETAWICTLSTA